MTGTTVITGANRGIGLAFCKQYLKKGYQVYACCRQPESAQELLTLKHHHRDLLHTMPLDVTNEAMRVSLSHSIGDQPVDILINNAGIYGPVALSFTDVSEKDWLENFRVNTIAPLLLTQCLINNILASQEKKIILMTSKMGSIGDNSSGAGYIYRSSKAALNAVGKSLAHDLSEKGVSVALVHPGWVKTDMGGDNAMITPEESVKGVIRYIETLNKNSSGQFINYDSSPIPW